MVVRKGQNSKGLQKHRAVKAKAEKVLSRSKNTNKSKVSKTARKTKKQNSAKVKNQINLATQKISSKLKDKEIAPKNPKVLVKSLKTQKRQNKEIKDKLRHQPTPKQQLKAKPIIETMPLSQAKPEVTKTKSNVTSVEEVKAILESRLIKI